MMQKIALFVTVAAWASLLIASPASSFRIKSKNSRCAPCNISELSDMTFTWRYLGACLVCGEFYGSEVEHCCMCYQSWFEGCATATGASPRSPQVVVNV